MLSFLISFFGFAIKIRLFSSLSRRLQLERKISIRIFCLILIFDLIVTFSFKNLSTVWLCQFLLLLIFFFTPSLVEAHLERNLRERVVSFLDQVMLSVQSGQSLRAAIKFSVDQESGWRKNELLKAYSSLILSTDEGQLRSKTLQTLFEELRWIDQGRNRTLDQLKSLRWHYKVHADFRRKSGQVSQQTRIQSVVVTLMYIALLIFQASHFGLRDHRGLIFVSVLMFLVGLILVFILGRRLKWKV